MSDFEGLCNSDYFSRYGQKDHWRGEYTNHRKRLVAWNRVSASQIESYQKCKRSWYFKSVMRIPEIQRGHQALGESFHLVMERVPKGIQWPSQCDTSATPEEWARADALAKIALPLLPPEPPNKAIRREWQINLETYPGGPAFIGYTDLAIPPGIGWPAFLIPDNEAIIGDYKTLSDFRYMKTPEELANSVQMMSYAKWAIEPWPTGIWQDKDTDLDLTDISPPNVRLLHLYARTKAPFNRQSIRHESAIVTPDQINTFWNKTLDTIREMQNTASSCTSFEDVEAGGALNGHCEAYGGCSFRDKCGIGKESSIKTLFQIGKKPNPTTGNTPDMSGSSILAKIQAARAAQGLTNPSSGQVQETNQPSAANSSSPESVSTTQVKLETPTGSPVASGPESASGSAKPVGPIWGLMKKIEAQNKGWPTLGGALAQSYAKERGTPVPSTGTIPGTGQNQARQLNTLGDLMKLASEVLPVPTGIVPPDAPPREQPVITKPGDPVVQESAPVATDDEEDVSDGVPIPTVQNDSTQLQAPKKRGRPSREEMAAREAQAKAEFEARVAQEVAKRTGQPTVNYDAQERDQLWESERVKLQAELDAAKRTIASMRQTTTAAPVDSGTTIYVDCYPVKGREEITDFFEWIGPIAKAVAESNGVADYRLINYTAKGLLATAMRQLIQAEGLPKAMTISTYAAGSDIALEVLTPLAKRVIKKI